MKMRRYYRTRPCPRCQKPLKEVSGSWLRRIREKAGLSLREVARRLGNSASYISDVELNRRIPTERFVRFYERGF